MQTGHDASTRSGTATFVMRRGQPYVCTCRHIMEGIKDQKMVPGSKFPTLALGIGRSVLNLGRMGANGVDLSMRAPKADRKEDEIDVAIAPLPDSYWALLTSLKQKSTIDLDAWREPNWSNLNWGIAAGYPDEHKTNVIANGTEQVGNQLITAVAKIESKPSPANRTVDGPVRRCRSVGAHATA
jgi:hypothetical protein